MASEEIDVPSRAMEIAEMWQALDPLEKYCLARFLYYEELDTVLRPEPLVPFNSVDDLVVLQENFSKSTGPRNSTTEKPTVIEISDSPTKETGKKEDVIVVLHSDEEESSQPPKVIPGPGVDTAPKNELQQIRRRLGFTDGNFDVYFHIESLVATENYLTSAGSRFGDAEAILNMPPWKDTLERLRGSQKPHLYSGLPLVEQVVFVANPNEWREIDNGNCYFTALALLLYGSANCYLRVKAEHLSYLEAVLSNPEHIRHDFYTRQNAILSRTNATPADGGTAWQGDVNLWERLQIPNCWTSDEMCALTADVYGIFLVMYSFTTRDNTRNNIGKHQVYDMRTYGAYNNRHLFAAYINGNHFIPLIPNSILHYEFRLPRITLESAEGYSWLRTNNKAHKTAKDGVDHVLRCSRKTIPPPMSYPSFEMRHLEMAAGFSGGGGAPTTTRKPEETKPPGGGTPGETPKPTKTRPPPIDPNKTTAILPTHGVSTPKIYGTQPSGHETPPTTGRKPTTGQDPTLFTPKLSTKQDLKTPTYKPPPKPPRKPKPVNPLKKTSTTPIPLPVIPTRTTKPTTTPITPVTGTKRPGRWPGPQPPTKKLHVEPGPTPPPTQPKPKPPGSEASSDEEAPHDKPVKFTLGKTTVLGKSPTTPKSTTSPKSYLKPKDSPGSNKRVSFTGPTKRKLFDTDPSYKRGSDEEEDDEDEEEENEVEAHLNKKVKLTPTTTKTTSSPGKTATTSSTKKTNPDPTYKPPKQLEEDTSEEEFPSIEEIVKKTKTTGKDDEKTKTKTKATPKPAKVKPTNKFDARRLKGEQQEEEEGADDSALLAAFEQDEKEAEEKEKARSPGKSKVKSPGKGKTGTGTTTFPKIRWDINPAKIAVKNREKTPEEEEEEEEEEEAQPVVQPTTTRTWTAINKQKRDDDEDDEEEEEEDYDY